MSQMRALREKHLRPHQHAVELGSLQQRSHRWQYTYLRLRMVLYAWWP